MVITLQLSTPLSFLNTKPASYKPQKTNLFYTKASESDPNPTPTTPSTQPESDSDFEDRLSRLRYRSGKGKKAEVRKTRKSSSSSQSNSSTSGGVFLPPVPLTEPVSGGLKVDFGFSPYSERLNGRIAVLGLTALLLVELATGESVMKFHSLPIIFLQVYFVAAVTAVYVKFEKEKVSVWPRPKTNGGDNE